MAYKVENIYYLALYRKSLPVSVPGNECAGEFRLVSAAKSAGHVSI